MRPQLDWVHSLTVALRVQVRHRFVVDGCIVAPEADGSAILTLDARHAQLSGLASSRDQKAMTVRIKKTQNGGTAEYLG